MILQALFPLALLLLQEVATYEIGNVDGTLGTDHGRAVYSLDVPYPNHFPDLMEKVEITYDSSADDGDAGYGWDISGLSTITRCPQTVAQDGKVRGIMYDADDRFCLDGQRLVMVAGDGKYGSDNTVYSTEIDSYQKVTSHGQRGSGPAHFTVRTKDNKILSFGGTDDASHIGTDGQSVHTWYLDSVGDYSGNKLKVVYDKGAGNGAHYVSKISYKDQLSVDFHYKPRDDVTTTYFRGGKLQVNGQLLYKVSAISFMGKEQSSLILNHQTGQLSGASRKSILTGYQYCGRDNKCLTPVKLGYSWQGDLYEMEKPLAWTHDFTSSPWTSKTIRQVMDVNGDGLDDIIGFKNDGVYVALNSGGGKFETSTRWNYAYGSDSASGGWSPEKHLRLVTDVNSDGLADIVGFGDSNVYASLNTGKGSFAGAKVMIQGAFSYNQGWRIDKHPRFVADVNGDGLPDVLGLANDGVYVSYNNKGDSFSLPKRIHNAFGYGASAGSWRGDKHPRFLEDVNGDGLLDLVGFHDGGVDVSVNIDGERFAFPSRWIYDFGTQRGWTVKDNERQLVDINGDGLPDILGFSPNNEVVVALNDGKKFLPGENWVHGFGTGSGYKGDDYPRYLADMNGDGLVDVVGFSCCGVYVSFNTGKKFTKPEKMSDHFHSSSWRYGPRVLRDVDANGVADIIAFAGYSVTVSINKNQPMNLIRIEDSYNNIDEIEYRPLGSASIYTRDTSATFPTPDINTRQLVVSKISSSDGIGGRNVSSYQYEGLRTNVQGRGSLGFKKITETKNGGETIEKTYHQGFPMTGLEDSSIHKVRVGSTNKIVSEYTNVYDSKQTGNKVHQVHLTQELATFYEINDNNELVKVVKRSFSDADVYGNYGTVDLEVTGGGKTFKEQVKNQYAKADEKNWYIDQVTGVTTTKSDESGQSVMTSEFVYDQSSRRVQAERRQPNEDLGVITEQVYDSFGNVIRQTQKPIHPKDRSNTTSSGRAVYKEYGSHGLLLHTTKNSLLHAESYLYDELGNVVKITGANGMNTHMEYDSLGRLTEERRADGTRATWEYSWCSSIPNAKYCTKKVETGKPTELTIYDSFERQIRTIVGAFKDDEDVVEDVVYDRNGRVVKQSIPRILKNGVEEHWVVYEYDAIGRDIAITKPKDKDVFSTFKTEYNGLTTGKTNGLGKRTVTRHDALGRVIEVTDAMGGRVVYKYDAMDNLVEVTDPAGNPIKNKFDSFGNKIESNDPDMGIWVYGYNAYGDVVWQRDAKGQESTTVYDRLGRKTAASYGSFTSTWEYDTAPKGLGKLRRVTSTDGFSREYTYDDKGREKLLSHKLNGETYNVKTTYNGIGRIGQQGITGPRNQQLYNCYNERGFLTMVRKSPCGGGDSDMYWNALEYDALGHLTKEKLGNGVVNTYQFTSGGYAESIVTKTGVSGSIIRKREYEHDKGGNLIQRRDLDTVETFEYDALDRITGAKIQNVTSGVAMIERWSYSKAGNIESYSELKGILFGYDKDKPHAVKTAGPYVFIYDENGNVVSKNQQTISWRWFNKPETLTNAKGKNPVELKYDADLRRFMKNGPGQSKTRYIGQMYERVTKGKKDTHKYFIYALGKLVAIEESKGKSGKTETIYLLSDHQFSIDTVTSNTGNVLERMSYNAFGRRRPGNWDTFQRCSVFLSKDSKNTNRGYTGHEQLEEADLIHANGRIYDPLIGRFLSADPLVQDPYNTQSPNRYTYTLNNPLKHNDPTGHSWRKIFRGAKKVVKTVISVAKKVVKVVKDTVKAAVKAVVNTAKQMWRDIKPYVRAYIADQIRNAARNIASKIVEFCSSSVLLAPLGLIAGMVVVGLGEYAASRVERKPHEEAKKRGYVAGVFFGLDQSGDFDWAKELAMVEATGKKPKLENLISLAEGPNYFEVLKENGPPMTLIGMSSGFSYLRYSPGSKMNANANAGISLMYPNSKDHFPTPFGTVGSQGPVHALLMDTSRERLIGLMQFTSM